MIIENPKYSWTNIPMHIYAITQLGQSEPYMSVVTKKEIYIHTTVEIEMFFYYYYYKTTHMNYITWFYISKNIYA